MRWFLSVFRANVGHHETLKVGSRVRTQYGSGVVTHGSIHIKYDVGTKLPGVKHPNERSRADNLNKVELI